MKYELNEVQAKNALVLLDRIEVKGFDEAQALLELRYVLSNPIDTEKMDS